uniref:Uncharacterized protein n=1 Tax=Nelumbo nucifera TaxID=4432 RepID=A0A822YKF8_NELNU|nr:TPA_asm: hypothetical protein HUJ06_010640 [Nelumbo nucifera]
MIPSTGSDVLFWLDSLGPQTGSRKRNKRKGGGVSAGQGKSCGFGMRYSEVEVRPGVRKGFEGDQVPLYCCIPKNLEALPELIVKKECILGCRSMSM